MNEKRFVVEIAHPPFPSKGREIIWHSRKFDASNPDHKDLLQPSMCQVWDVQAYNRNDALAKIILGKGTKLFG